MEDPLEYYLDGHLLNVISVYDWLWEPPYPTLIRCWNDFHHAYYVVFPHTNPNILMNVDREEIIGRFVRDIQAKEGNRIWFRRVLYHSSQEYTNFLKKYLKVIHYDRRNWTNVLVEKLGPYRRSGKQWVYFPAYKIWTSAINIDILNRVILLGYIAKRVHNLLLFFISIHSKEIDVDLASTDIKDIVKVCDKRVRMTCEILYNICREFRTHCSVVQSSFWTTFDGDYFADLALNFDEGLFSSVPRRFIRNGLDESFKKSRSLLAMRTTRLFAETSNCSQCVSLLPRFSDHQEYINFLQFITKSLIQLLCAYNLDISDIIVGGIISSDFVHLTREGGKLSMIRIDKMYPCSSSFVDLLTITNDKNTLVQKIDGKVSQIHFADGVSIAWY